MREIPENIDHKYNLKVYFGLLKKYKGLFALVVLLILFIEASNVADKFLFKTIVDKGTEFAAKNITQSQFANVLIIVALIFVAVYLTRAILRWLHLHFINRLEGKLILDLKRKFFDHIVGLSYNFHTSHKTGSMISRLTRGGRAIEAMTDDIIFFLFPLIFQLIIVSLSLIYFDVQSAITIFVFVVVFITYSYIMQRMQQSSSVIANKTEDFEKGQIADMLTNIESIKYFGKEKFVNKKFEGITDDTKKAAIKNWDYYRFTDSGQTLLIGIGTFFVLYFPLIKFLNNEITLGTLVFIYTVYGNLMNPLFNFVRGMRDYYRVMADFESLFEYNKIENEIKDKEDAIKLEIRNGDVEFNNVSFNYGKRKIFKEFSLKAPKNKKIALVGHSGSGKTTLVKLIYRFYDVDSGSILIDGKNVKDFKQESLRAEMSIVPQECVLFDDTIYNNVAFSRPNASRKEVLQAIKFAQLDKIIKDFPNKEETIVGERGVKLSGGEKQRVSIARAILANKKILVLDEATSSLDSQTEYDIQQDLKRLMKGRTTIIIAHRLSTIMTADKIVVLKKGKIVQMGTHNQLIKKPGEYRKLWNLQKGGYIK